MSKRKSRPRRDSLFDYNRDGRTDVFERAISYAIFEEISREEDEEEAQSGFRSSRSDHSWRDNCADGREYDIDPTDFDTETEYTDVLDAAKEVSSFRQRGSLGFLSDSDEQEASDDQSVTSGLMFIEQESDDEEDFSTDSQQEDSILVDDSDDPDADFEEDDGLSDDTEDFNNSPLHQTLKRGSYSEEETAELLEEEEDPDFLTDDDTSSEYAIDASDDLSVFRAHRSTSRFRYSDLTDMDDIPDDLLLDDLDPVYTNCSHKAARNRPARPIDPVDGLEKRKSAASRELAAIQRFPDQYTDEECAQKKNICTFILEGAVTAARYLTIDRGFLYVQAVKEHFTLPCTFPYEDTSPKTWFVEMIQRVSRRDSKLSMDIWAWCLREFSPYQKFTPYDHALFNGMLNGICHCSDNYIHDLIGYFEMHEEFPAALFGANPAVPDNVHEIVCTALRTGRHNAAKLVFRSFLQNANVTASDIETVVYACLSTCRCQKEVETMEAFRDQIYYPLLKKLQAPEIKVLFRNWENKIQDHIEYEECMNPRYAYSRRFIWRLKYRDQAEQYADPLRFEKESEYLKAAEREKQFRKEEEEQTAAKNYRDQDVNLSARPVEKTDNNIYEFCSVMFENGSQAYTYRTGSVKVDVGDRVIVPVGHNKKVVSATVVSVGRYAGNAVPYPVEKTSVILRKVEDQE